MIRTLFLFTMIFLAMNCIAQKKIKGKVFDKSTGNALAFVTVLTGDQNQGTYTDIDGKFELLTKGPLGRLRLSYVGYESKEIEVKEDGELIIYLEPKSIELSAAVVGDDENPAHRIIREVIRRKDEHDPEKGTPFSYESYNKLVFTADIDSALLADPDPKAPVDSSDLRAIEFFNEQHIFMMESVSERQFMPPDRNNEVIKATRVSGLKNPDFALLGTQLQSFSFYKEEIELLGDVFLSPIAKGAISKYVYTIEDTTYQDRDSVFIISYQPRRKKNFIGLKGVLYINTNGYALQSVIAGPFESDEEGVDIRIQQKYEWINEQKWFPTQLNSTIYFNSVSLNAFRMVGIGRSYLDNIKLDPPLEKRDFNHVILKMDKKATKQPESYWNQYRTDSLDSKELRTYEFVDSLSKAENLELKLNTLNALLSGRVPMGPFNLDLSRLLAFRNFEGIRLGVGLETSDKVSRVFRLSGYTAYGFKDQQWKYGGKLRATIDRKRDIYAEVLAEHDLVEFGGQSFREGPILFSPTAYYRLYLNRMELYDAAEFAFGFRARGFSQWRLSARRERREAFENYTFQSRANDFVTLENRMFDLFLLKAEVRLAFGEKFVETIRRRFSAGTKYPVVQLSYSQALEGPLDGSLEFSRMDVMVNYKKRFKNLGESKFRLMGAYIDSPLPASLLINPRATYTGTFGFFSPFAFETMRVNEFLADQWISFHWRHSFKSLLFRTKHFAPELVLVNNAGIGTLSSAVRHEGISFEIPEKAFLETGFQVDNLLMSGLSGIGVGAFYRYGSWALEDPMDNWAFKLTSVISF